MIDNTLAYDSWEAGIAWAEFANKRWQHDSPDPRDSGYESWLECYLEARETFVTEFLFRRGWRQLPESKWWV